MQPYLCSAPEYVLGRHGPFVGLQVFELRAREPGTEMSPQILYMFRGA